ncbi:TetR family transcriptional regulator [Leucobacter luti]|uniref:TetR/AcrR family transcriptional regulator n=1 Tax=Leucobacter luti TaxID=340320 RepID=UPI001050CD31|nr:TetR/AcrR family transcriptional regulator [Leucobacter luti]MCW2287074.1 AcrR family transcriptional regulator [Leucobacter luti]TCK41298.1 TetR family transcriptional regulator [Leucobacter luti]
MVESSQTLGRPRSEDARLAVLHAVDDLLVSEGYAAMTMKGIAERAKVGRQTVYRWWSSKAEILLEASAADAVRELTVAPADDAEAEITAFLGALVRFLTDSDAGLAYRALLGEAQHDPKVADLIRGRDPLGDAARAVIRSTRARNWCVPDVSEAALAAELVGPVVYRVLGEGWRGDSEALRGMAQRFLRADVLE